MKIIPSALALAASLLLTAHVGAAELSAGDKMFVMKAAQGGMTEVKLGQLASEKAANADIKSFGAMMVTDHTKAGDELAALAKKEGVEAPADLDKKHAAVVDEMSKMSGEAFDQAYVADNVKAHKSTIALFEKEANDGKNPELKTFAEKTLPTLKTHLAKIEAIQKSM